MRAGLSATLLALALPCMADAGVPDPADMAALGDLRQAVDAARRTHPDLPLETALAGLAIKSGTTWFGNELGAPGAAAMTRFPQARPEGVSAAEWRALLASRIDGAGENGRVGYLLIDLDGDGLRDLAIESDLDLDGAGHIVHVLRQADGRFGKPAPVSPGAAMPNLPSALYALFERGANQSADWIRLRGRVYAAFRDSRYGADRVYLLRPWQDHGQLPRLSISYRYQLSVPALQKPGAAPAARLAPARQRALDAAAKLAAIRAAELSADPPVNRPATPPTPICPVAADADEDVRQASTGYGPAPYTTEAVADVPVRIGGQCYIGQLRNWFGAYTPKMGLAADLCIRKPEEPGPSPEACYRVQGRRSVSAVSAGMAPFDATQMMPLEP